MGIKARWRGRASQQKKMAKWEHWFWVTIFLLFESRCRGQHHNQGLEFIDTLTAPTLQPRPGEEAVEVSSSGGLFSRPPIEKPRNAGLINRRKDYNEDSKEEKLTIITPSSVVVMSTPATRPRPTTITASVPPTSEEASTQNFETAASQPQDVSVSHSFSVVRISQNVKYSSSSDSSATKSEAEKSEAESETNKSVEAGEASEQDSLAASLLETASADLQNRFFQKKPLSSTTISTTTTVLSSTLPTATTITSVEKSSKNTTVTSTKTEAKSEAEISVVSASKAKSASEDPHRAPKSIVHPRNPDNRLLLLDRPFHLSATTTQPVIHTSTTTDSHITSSAVSTSTVTASPTTTTLEAETDTSTIKTNFFEGMKYEHNILENQGQPQQPQQTQRMSGGHHQKTTVVTTEIRPMSKSETARALDELGFEYNEYMDDSELLGDDNNDEVIPPFHEENYEHDEMVPVQQQSRDHSSDYHFSSARAIPSKSGSLSGLGSLVYEDPTHNSLHNSKLEAPAESADVVSATSRQSKKAPLPHHYEPSTIAGITIGAFLLIFIGTVGLGAFIYHERYVNKPHTLDDGFSDSGGCSTSVDDSIGRVSHIDCSGLDITTDTYCEEMYNLDNDSFLNSLETVAMPTMLWSVAPHSDSDV